MHPQSSLGAFVLKKDIYSIGVETSAYRYDDTLQAELYIWYVDGDDKASLNLWFIDGKLDACGAINL